LVSADFLASDFISEDELPPLLEKAERDGAIILPVVISPCRFVETRNLSQFQAVNDPAKPLLDQSKADQERVFLNLSKVIEQALSAIQKEESPRSVDRILAGRSNSTEQESEPESPVIKAIGVGGGGCNAIQHMVDEGLQGVGLISVNTDVQALRGKKGHQVIRIGDKTTRGLGTGGNPGIGRISAEESTEKIVEAIEGTHLLFVTAGMGGGTGTGAAPVIASIANKLGILTIGVVTKPFYFEGRVRRRYAEQGIEEMVQYVDSLIVVPNEKIFAVADSKETLQVAFSRVDEVLRWIVEGIAYIIVKPGLINVDYADLKAVMSNKGYARMGTGVCLRENNGAEEAARNALDNPLTESLEPKEQQGVLVNIVGGSDISIGDVETIGRTIGKRFSGDSLIIVGTALDEDLVDEIRVTVIATGYDPSPEPQWTQPA
jgi:cell division protein FtsZ